MDITLPRLGEGAESGTVVTIMVKVGDQIQKDQTILELENEKAVAPIPSPAAGRVRAIHVTVGDKISVGQKLISLAGAGPEPSEEAVAPAPAAPKPTPPPSVPGEPKAGEVSEPPPAAPSVRKMARELGIDLTRIKGSERGGRITVEDLKAHIQRLRTLGAGGAAPTASIDFSKWGPVKRQPLSALRQAISKKMSASWSTVPHVTQFDEADITALMALKQRHDAAYEQRGAKLTLTSFVLAALVDVLRKHPVFNASLDEAAGAIVYKDYYHVGVAVETEQGLIVPILRHVDKKTMVELSKELQALAEKTRQRKVTLEELQGGTFTVSNQGGIGGAHFTPIINTPEVAILGIGRGVLKPVVTGERIEPRLMLPLALSYDHRVIDGAHAARFIRDLVQALERFPENKVKG